MSAEPVRPRVVSDMAQFILFWPACGATAEQFEAALDERWPGFTCAELDAAIRHARVLHAAGGSRTLH